MQTVTPSQTPRPSNPFATPTAGGADVFATLAPSGSVDVMFDAASDAAPSTQDLLARAARLAAVRPPLESVLMPSDPVLGKKQEPAVAARRERFTRIVKATLGGCVALCVAALAATAMSGEASASEGRAPSAAAPAHRVPSREALGADVRTKAARTAAPAARGPKAPVRAKRR